MAENSKEKFGECLFCKRECRLTFHHLIPRKVHRRAHYKKHFSKAELNEGVAICRQCHSGIHKQYDEMQLAKIFNTAEALAADATLQRHFAWVSKQRVKR